MDVDEYDFEKEGNHDAGGGAWWIFLIPIVIIILTFIWFGYWLAKNGAKFRTVQFWTIPSTFFLMNMIGVLLIFPMSFLYTMFTGDKGPGTWVWSNWCDLTVFPIWGRILSFVFRMGLTEADYALKIPVGAVLTYQLILLFGVGLRISRHLTTTLMDMAVAVNAKLAGYDPYDAREVRLKNDKAYAEAAKHYKETGKPPFFGFFGVSLVGTWPNDIYRFLK
ncbi:hypothetical protein KTQ42_15605|uniref:hypothetical protein n=1 Tax=Noviherbaspirillum sp. L7-7A TaxID=2850560 RepID=UPI001C2C24CD|nr:hypothetical protein [Noviherbaspirillum sp. L7-7A]MBV0880727.1 hypothetical protein [Noviherbaspirillum sp. L7-7A]